MVMATRRLAAIVVVDVVGFSAMMAQDEEGTLASLKAHRDATDPIFLNHGARIVKSTGDGLIIEVPSAVDAVRAAHEAQQEMARRNAELPEERRMRFRFGIHLGDVLIEDDGDVYGDGVNVAARLEALAEPGGICLSEVVRRQVAGVLSDTRFDDGGERELKNIPEAVHVWTIAPPGVDVGEGGPGTRRPFSPQTTVAVLPFDDLSADADQEHIADGITEDLITALSRDVELQVVARNSVFALKGRPADVRTVGRRLDARYVVEGSVRRSGERVRVTAQLIEAETGTHVWGERYDREFGDVFTLQDEIVEAVRIRVLPEVRSREERRLSGVQVERMDAWELLHRARWHGNRHDPENAGLAVELGERAAELSASAAPHVMLAYLWTEVAMQGWRLDGRNAFGEILSHAEAAYRLAPDDASTLAAVAHARSYTGDTTACVDLARRGVELNPHIPETWLSLAHTSYFDGRHDEAVEAGTESWRLGAHEAWRWHTAMPLAYAHYLKGAYEPSLQWTLQALALNDYLQARTIAAASLAQLGRHDEAAPHLERVLQERPGLTVGAYRRRFNWRRPEDIHHFLAGLAKAGMPE